MVALAITGGVSLRAVEVASRDSLGHDEAISVLAATCHQGEFARIVDERRPPFGAWVPAVEWQRLSEPETPFCFGTIARDLAAHDIHPPLFFWLLHVWVLIAGTGPVAAPALNVLIAAAGTLALYALARRALRDPCDAALVAVVWALSPGVIRIAAEARHYELFALTSIVLTSQALRYAAAKPSRRPREGALLAVATAAGMLTHFQFAIVAAGVAGLLVVLLGRRSRRSLAGALAALAIGAALLPLVSPGLGRTLARQQSQAAPLGAGDVHERLGEVGLTLAGALVPAGVTGPAIAFAVLAALAAAATLRAGRSAAGAFGATERARPAAGVHPATLLALAAWVASLTCALYVAGASHANAMSAKYLTAAWPFLAAVPVLALRRRGRVPLRSAAALALTFLALASVSVVAFTRGDLDPLDPTRPATGRDHRPPDPRPALLDAQRMVTDVTLRGRLPTVVRELRPETRVLVADARTLLREERWLRLLARGDLVALRTRSGETFVLRRPVERSRAVTELDGGVWGYGLLLQVRSDRASPR